MTKTENHIQNQGVALRNLENQVGQLANALSSRHSGSLPSNTEVPQRDGKEHCKVIHLRSGKEITTPAGQEDEQLVDKTTNKVLKDKLEHGTKIKFELQLFPQIFHQLQQNKIFLS